MSYFIFGLQRSGTNFTEQLVQQNFHISKENRHNKCWKHSIDFPNGYKKQHATLIIHKNPYTWIESICLRNTVDWVKRQKDYPITDQIDKELKLKNFNTVNLAKTYKHWYDTWLGDTDQQLKDISFQIKYEDLLIKNVRNDFLDHLHKKFKWRRKSKGPDWIVPTYGKVSQSRDYDRSREEYYLSMKPEQLTTKHISAINDVIGKDIISKLGYPVL